MPSKKGPKEQVARPPWHRMVDIVWKAIAVIIGVFAMIGKAIGFGSKFSTDRMDDTRRFLAWVYSYRVVRYPIIACKAIVAWINTVINPITYLKTIYRISEWIANKGADLTLYLFGIGLITPVVNFLCSLPLFRVSLLFVDYSPMVKGSIGMMLFYCSLMWLAFTFAVALDVCAINGKKGFVFLTFLGFFTLSLTRDMEIPVWNSLVGCYTIYTAGMFALFSLERRDRAVRGMSGEQNGFRVETK